MRTRKAVTWGLLAAWALHETEEAAVMAAWLQKNLPRLQERLPRVPERTWERISRDMTPGRVRVGIALMGVLMAGAAADGARTGGRSLLYQAALAGYGWHGLIHLGQTAAFRGYTPGVATTPFIVLPFSIWAWRELARSEAPNNLARASGVAFLLFPAGLAASQAGAAAIMGQKGSAARTAEPAHP